MDNQELKQDCQEVRGNLKELYEEVRSKKINLKRATALIYCASNILRSIATELMVNKEH